MDYQFKSQPYVHQRTCFDRSKDEEIFAILFEMGTGKSKVVIDTAAYLYSLGRINALVVIAPNGVHTKWKKEDVPFSLPDYIDYKCAVWEAGNKQSMADCENLMNSGEHLRILLVNVEGFSYEALPKFMKRFLLATDALVAVDESTRIKSPSAARTKALMKLKQLMKYRRILAGDAVVNSPFDLFSQFGFLSEEILGYSYPAFKAEHAEMVSADDRLMIAIMRKTGAKHMPQIAVKNADGSVRYKNLDKLKERIAPYSMRVTKAECLDLPPKIYEKRYFKLEPKQRAMYDQMVADCRYELNDVTVPILHKLTLLLRLQQMCSGFVKDKEGKTINMYAGRDKDNPRIAALLDFLEDVEGQVIIWCRFQEEIKAICRVLGDLAVPYYGVVVAKEREVNMALFKSKEKKFLVGTAKVGGIGLNLIVASTTIYYSNTFNAGERWQSEDRTHRIGQEAEKVLYIDIEAEDTVDSKIITSLRAKKDLSDYMLELQGLKQQII